jgi:hypothetical protein
MSLDQQPATPTTSTISQGSDAEPVMPAPRVRSFPLVGANPGPRFVYYQNHDWYATYSSVCAFSHTFDRLNIFADVGTL